MNYLNKIIKFTESIKSIIFLLNFLMTLITIIYVSSVINNALNKIQSISKDITEIKNTIISTKDYLKSDEIVKDAIGISSNVDSISSEAAKLKNKVLNKLRNN